MMKEYRVNAKGSTQGNYVIADSPSQARDIVQKKYPNEKLEVHLWKTSTPKSHFPVKLSSYAKKKMRRM